MASEHLQKVKCNNFCWVHRTVLRMLLGMFLKQPHKETLCAHNRALLTVEINKTEVPSVNFDLFYFCSA